MLLSDPAICQRVIMHQRCESTMKRISSLVTSDPTLLAVLALQFLTLSISYPIIDNFMVYCVLTTENYSYQSYYSMYLFGCLACYVN